MLNTWQDEWQALWRRPPSQRRIAWIGTLAGLLVIALPLVIAFWGSGGSVVFLLSLLFTGFAETGWGVELFPRRWTEQAGWGRVARWLCAIIGLGLGAASVIFQLAPLWFSGIVTIGALLLVFEMAPGGPANRR
jgi:hypothetical protein